MTTPPDGGLRAGNPAAAAVVDVRGATVEDAEELFATLGDERVWACGYAGGPSARWPDVAGARAWLAGADRTPLGGRQAYTIRLAADSDLGPRGTLVGTSSLAEWSLVDERVHLGWTAYGPTWWGTLVNPASKLLLLLHAFDECGFGRVKIQTDLINTRSQAAIARFGAIREGVLRRHIRRPDGTWRDTVVFSVLRDEWPSVRTGLEDRLRP